VDSPLPERFRIDRQANWLYFGREKFAKLLDMFEDMQSNQTCSTLWLYGTQGYGKSHLLATLVCCLVAKGERVVFIPDCRECVKRPVDYIQAAMIFAWADDDEKRHGKINLDATTLQGVWQQASTFVTEMHEQKIHWDTYVLLFSSLERY
jgi:hypothetical protein